MPCLLRYHTGIVNWEAEPKSEAENGNDLVYWTEGDLKHITDDADFSGSFQSSKEENQEIRSANKYLPFMRGDSAKTENP